MKLLIQKLANSCGYHISRTLKDPFQELRRLMGDNSAPLCFDVGAHHGETAKQLRRVFPAATIHSFEPTPASFQHLNANLESDPAAHAHNFGMSDTSGSVNFHSNTFSPTNSLLPPKEGTDDVWGNMSPHTESIIQVQMRTLDEVMEQLSIPRVNILKMDVQSAEHLVLQGAENACKNGQIDIIYTEIMTKQVYSGQKRLDEFLGYFFDAGFALHNFYNPSLTKNGDLRCLDGIFIKS